ncbi:MAG: DUF4170 domain-containing protein [Stellaceae bacterium]
MSNYWVIGGEYADTSFTKLAPGATEERLGPYGTYRAAYEAWQARARATIDDATVRFRIVDEHGRIRRDKKRAA